MLRCPYCHEDLSVAPSIACDACATETHLACLAEHGGCPIMGCAEVAHPAVEPGHVSWDEFVREAQAWLSVGSEISWDAPGAGDTFLGPAGPSDGGSASGSRAA